MLKKNTIGKKIIVEPNSYALSQQELYSVEKLQPSGFMFRSRNFLNNASYDQWFEQYQLLRKQIANVLDISKLIFCVDHEGGQIVRFPTPVTRFPYAAFWKDSLALVAKAMAIELKSLGINVSFAPVADIHSNPDNPVIKDRAFACTKDEVLQSALVFTETLMKNGVFACAKHFPGHGDTSEDSHYDLPVLDLSETEVFNRELVPFQALIDIAIPMIMTGHLMFPKIDAKNCATCSAKILTDILRTKMNFKGVVISDAFCMEAVKNNLHQPEFVNQAVNAGLDIFLIAGPGLNMENALRLAENIELGLNNGKINQQIFENSIDRIDNLISNLPYNKLTKLSKKQFLKHQALADKLMERQKAGSLNLKGNMINQ